MLLLQALLDVVCCGCGQRMAVTVKCEGGGLNEGGDAKALASLGCTACGKRNYVVFAPESGEVVEVMDRLEVLRIPEPSLN